MKLATRHYLYISLLYVASQKTKRICHKWNSATVSAFVSWSIAWSHLFRRKSTYGLEYKLFAWLKLKLA